MAEDFVWYSLYESAVKSFESDLLGGRTVIRVFTIRVFIILGPFGLSFLNGLALLFLLAVYGHPHLPHSHQSLVDARSSTP